MSDATDSEAELQPYEWEDEDEYLSRLLLHLQYGETDSPSYLEAKAFLKLLFARHRQAAVEEALEDLLEQLPDDSVVTRKYGYNSKEKKYGFRIGITEAKLLIQDQLNRLREKE
jgi:hypothetical protein